MIVSHVELFTFNENHSFAPTDKMNNATARSIVTGIREIWNFEFDRPVNLAVQPENQGLVKFKPIYKQLDARTHYFVRQRDRVVDPLLNTLCLIGHRCRENFPFPRIGYRR